VAVRPDGGIYVADYYHHKIESFDSSGAIVSEATEVDPGDGPCGLALLSNGELAVNSYHRNAFSFSHPDQVGWSVESADPSESTGIAYALASDLLYVNDRSYVTAYDVSGPEPVEAMRIGEGSLTDAYGLAVSGYPGTEGFVYVADAATDTVEVFDPATSLTAPVQTIDGAGTPEGGLYNLHDAALAIDDSTGDLFVVRNVQGPFYEHPRAAVAEFNPAGEYRGTLPGVALRFGEPSAIAVDNTGGSTQGRVYVTSGNSQVEDPRILATAVTPEHPGTPEEGAVYAFGPTAPGARFEVGVTGAGTVSSEPTGIACPGACAAEYDEGSTVELTATADPGSVFAGWSGGGCSGTGTCTVTLNADVSASAEFSAASGFAGSAVGDSTTDARGAFPSAPPPGAATGPAAAGSTLRAAPASARQRRHHAKQRRRHLRHHRHLAQRKGKRR